MNCKDCKHLWQSEHSSVCLNKNVPITSLTKEHVKYYGCNQAELKIEAKPAKIFYTEASC